jgi:hypothetical protein
VIRYSPRGLFSGGLHAEDELRKVLSGLQELGLGEELLKALLGVVEDQASEQRLSHGSAEEGVVAFFGDVDTDHQVLSRSANLLFQLTEFLESGIIVSFHRDLLVKIMVMCGHQQIA